MAEVSAFLYSDILREKKMNLFCCKPLRVKNLYKLNESLTHPPVLHFLC